MAIEHIQTPRQVFESLKEEGYRIEYERIPISPEQAPEDRYIDEFLHKIGKRSVRCPLVFNCGMGLGRTTFSMVMAMLIRRKQMLLTKDADPFNIKSGSNPTIDSQMQNECMIQLIQLLEQGTYSSLGIYS